MFNWRVIRQLTALMGLVEQTVADMGRSPFEMVFRRFLIPSLKIAHRVHVQLRHISFPGPDLSWRIGDIDFELEEAEDKSLSIRVRNQKLPVVPDADGGFLFALGENRKTATACALGLSRAAIEAANRAMEEADAVLRQRFEQSVSGRSLFPTEDMVEAAQQAMDWLVAEICMLRSVLAHLESIDPPVFYIAPGVFYPYFRDGAVFLDSIRFNKNGVSFYQRKITSDKKPTTELMERCQKAAEEQGLEETECIRGMVETLKEAAIWIGYHRTQATNVMKAETKGLVGSSPKALIRDFLHGVFGALRAMKILKYPSCESAFLEKLPEVVGAFCLARGRGFSWFWLPSYHFGTGFWFPSIARSGSFRQVEAFLFDPCELDRIVERMTEDIERNEPEGRVFLLLDLWRTLGEIAEGVLNVALSLPDE